MVRRADLTKPVPVGMTLMRCPMSQLMWIEGDPNIWRLRDDVGAADLSESREPFRAKVLSPLVGTLLLSPKASIALYDTLSPEHPVHPNGIILVERPLLYLPSMTVLKNRPASASPMEYPLLPDTNIAELEREIAAAMTRGTFHKVPFNSVDETGVLVLNGATLPFVVLCPRHDD
jgi:hypothetical protein